MSAPDKGDPTGFAAEGSQFLTFRLEDEEYGLEILRVQEIKGYSKITPLPNTPREIKGVMNLRGSVVPIIDLRARFGLREAEYTRFTVIIVVTVGSKIIGLVVDAVSDVLNVASKEMVPTPDLGAGVDTTFLTGIARTGDRLVSLLNVDRLIGITSGGPAV
ncbi:chemotaxis protein CheW [Frigoriglobus tundricola]|uniref:Chemotaxis protein CheW n=1 Tax=Frigoriglobus tundricola TaxID=2774151 RepID=A0A6M5YVN6_9BACT|nr:chemotaxis protein CheW [Frigoriglobus tundricola]QJW98009.1 Positive regulator of CheA protein activity (CheW) [Frigoriglobus tundricola]